MAIRFIADCDIDHSFLENICEVVRYEDSYLVQIISGSTTKEQKQELKEMLSDGVPSILLGSTLASFIGFGNIKRYRGTIQRVGDCDVMLTASADEAIANENTLFSLAKDVHTMVSMLNGTYSDTSTNFKVLTTLDEVKEVIEITRSTGEFSFDFETSKINKDKVTYAEDFNVTALGISFQSGGAYVIPINHFQHDWGSDYGKLIHYIKNLFEDVNVTKIAHNASYDFHVLRFLGIEVRGRIEDTMLKHHLIDETLPHGLKELVKTYLPHLSGYDDKLAGMDWNTIPLSMLAPYLATDADVTFQLNIQLELELQEDKPSYVIYRNLTMAGWKALHQMERNGMEIDLPFIDDAVKDAEEVTIRLEESLQSDPIVLRYRKWKHKQMVSEELAKLEETIAREITKYDESYKKKYDTLEDKVTLLKEEGKEKQFLTWERKLDEHKNNYNPDDRASVAKAKAKIRDLKTGNDVIKFNVNFASQPQLMELLYTSPVGFRFEAFKKSTDKEALTELDDPYGFVDQLLLLRTVKKVRDTYLIGLKTKQVEGFIHSSFLLNGTASGRLSSKNPNLQNVPSIAKIKNEEASRIVSYVKKCFKAPDGGVLLQADYSQAELRTIASFAKDETMLQVYREDKDIHTVTGMKVAKLSEDDFKQMAKADQKEIRQKAKAINFGFIYGMSAKGFMHYAKNSYGVIFTLKESETIRNAFFDLYSNLTTYHEIYKAKGRKFGWVRTLFGRRRRLPNINSNIDALASADERVAVNSPIQGSAGEFTVFAIALLHLRLPYWCKVVNTVHDSIVIYVMSRDKARIATAVKLAKDTMENLPMIQFFGKELAGVKLKADIELSDKNWKELVEYDEYMEM